MHSPFLTYIRRSGNVERTRARLSPTPQIGVVTNAR